MRPLPSYFCNYFKRRKLISHLGNKEGSWLLSWITRINMNSDMQTPEECNKAKADWKQEIAALLASCDWVLPRWHDRGQSCSRGGTSLDDRNTGWNLEAASGYWCTQKCKQKKPQNNTVLSSRDDTRGQLVLPCFHFCDHIWNSNFSFFSLAEK